MCICSQKYFHEFQKIQCVLGFLDNENGSSKWQYISFMFSRI